jgi:hypothetical protein
LYGNDFGRAFYLAGIYKGRECGSLDNAKIGHVTAIQRQYTQQS